MSAPHEEDDLAATSTPGYNPGQEKSIDELAKLDAEDESLARWKASLGIVAGAGAGPATGPKVLVQGLELVSRDMPQGKRLSMNVQEMNENTKMKPFTIKEGVTYNVRMTFKVNHGITSGIRYIQSVRSHGVQVDKMEQMLGSYHQGSGDNKDGIVVKDFPEEESPSGFVARNAGTYNVKSRVIDDDGNIFAQWEWSFKLAKEW